jgi:hypothetical protein
VANRRNPSSGADLIDKHLGQADVANFALSLEVDQYAQLVLDRHLRINSVLEQVDSFHSKTSEAQFRLLAQVLRSAARMPPPGPVRTKPASVAIYQFSGVWVQRLVDQRLGHIPAV